MFIADANDVSKSSRRRASMGATSMPSWRAAASVSFSDSTAGGSSGFHRAATRERPSMISLSNWSRFPLNSGDRRLLPVMFPPGRAKLATNPLPTGSLLAVITMGMLWVACRTARTACEPPATITSTFRLTSSAASRASVSVRSATRYSMRVFLPSTYPNSRNPCRIGPSRFAGASTPMRRIRSDC